MPSLTQPVSLDELERQVPLESNLYVERPPIEDRSYEVILSSEARVPYIANAKGGCNMEITVKCEFPKKAE